MLADSNLELDGQILTNMDASSSGGTQLLEEQLIRILGTLYVDCVLLWRGYSDTCKPWVHAGRQIIHRRSVAGVDRGTKCTMAALCNPRERGGARRICHGIEGERNKRVGVQGSIDVVD